MAVNAASTFHTMIGGGSSAPQMFSYTDKESTLAEITTAGYFSAPSTKEIKSKDLVYLIGSDGADLAKLVVVENTSLTATLVVFV